VTPAWWKRGLWILLALAIGYGPFFLVACDPTLDERLLFDQLELAREQVKRTGRPPAGALQVHSVRLLFEFQGPPPAPGSWIACLETGDVGRVLEVRGHVLAISMDFSDAGTISAVPQPRTTWIVVQQ
jgi:hypothetical protein